LNAATLNARKAKEQQYFAQFHYESFCKVTTTTTAWLSFGYQQLLASIDTMLYTQLLTYIHTFFALYFDEPLLGD